MTGTLETMQPAADADLDDDAVGTLRSLSENVVFRVWGGDWCGDCQNQLPTFAAALDEAGVDPAGDRVHHYPVEKNADGSKSGELVDEYDIELIPTVVVELDGEELARFVEDAPDSIAVTLANQLSTADLTA
ncbi:thioredoxin family protein [Halocalculus aciditolerans]|uniref:Thioredoxin n=1 Tax=Halocalculus aciditolerans TaxID=1383812 RepID=A0A830F9Z1_9EURY|nr:thioredoxin family protein [Halocalculus aciditolerans]GGL53730.1 thioredoxin [Halocalculus aciditolerans]